MAETDFIGVKLRARYEHFKSTPKERKTYVTLGFIALEDGELVVAYYDEYADGAIHFSKLTKFISLVMTDDNVEIPRFTLLEENVILGNERDAIWEEVDDYLDTK